MNGEKRLSVQKTEYKKMKQTEYESEYGCRNFMPEACVCALQGGGGARVIGVPYGRLQGAP